MRFVKSMTCLVAVWSAFACSDGGGGDQGALDATPDTTPDTTPHPVGSGDGEAKGSGSGVGGSSASIGSASGGSGSSAVPSIGAPVGTAPGAAPGSSGPSHESSSGAPSSAGVLTAGAWDDNRNFDRFLGYRSGLVASQLPGLLPITEDELQAAHALWGDQPTAHSTLDVSLVIDTTGSMGDEIGYLQAEFLALSRSISAQYPSAEQRWSLVVYRDDTDDYVTRWFDFRSDPEDFRTHLAAQGANGGGDFPEAPDRAFEVAQQLAWRPGAGTARLAFWVADAPHHDERAGAMADALRGMRDQGVHVYPVASSGVDELTELSMRTAATLTGGRYLFLTNDSGIGGDHKEPTIPCYFVTSLRDAIGRMVDIEMSGEYREPSVSELIRTGGDPKDGACHLESGQSVSVF